MPRKQLSNRRLCVLLPTGFTGGEKNFHWPVLNVKAKHCSIFIFFYSKGVSVPVHLVRLARDDHTVDLLARYA